MRKNRARGRNLRSVWSVVCGEEVRIPHSVLGEFDDTVLIRLHYNYLIGRSAQIHVSDT